MSAVSPRFAVWIAALFAAAALPVLIHASSPVAEACADGVDTGDQAVEVSRPDGVTLRHEVTVTREPWQLYHRPYLRLTGVSFPDAPERRDLEVDGTVLPLYWEAERRPGASRARGYFYIFDGRPVSSPFAAGLARVGQQLIGGTLPLTRVVAYAEGPAERADGLARAVESQLAEAWRRHRELCRS